MISSDEYQELTEYVHAEGTEIGEYLCSLLCLSDFNEDHGMSTKFREAISVELSCWLTKFRIEYELKTVVTPQPDRVHKELIWIGDEE